jgi:hypothetical protein
MQYNLFVNYYLDKNPTRQQELDFCIGENLKNESISFVVVVATAEDYIKFWDNFCDYESKIMSVISADRPTYNHFFQLTRKIFGDTDNINIISNSDMIIPQECIELLPLYISNQATCLALSRWDAVQMKNYRLNAALFDRADSQDTWIFKGGVPNINGADFTMGIAGCDNSIAYLLSAVGYNVVNPAQTLKTYHIHLSNIRNYISGEVIDRVPPPYKLIPTSI